MDRNHYQKDQEDKINTLNRCFFDAEHGWLTLSLNRIEDLNKEFPDDSQIEYAEALIRKDFLGEGIKAEELFIKAQNHSAKRHKSNENYLFSTFNAVKYARNEEEFQKQFKIALSVDPEDRDISFLNSILRDLNDGVNYCDILAGAVAEYQKHSKHGECASFAELALNSGTFSLENELELRKARMASLRELDKTGEASRKVRGEGFPPEERLTLKEALIEIEKALLLDPSDHLLWNFKSAWLYLMDECEEAIVAAETSLKLCPTAYLKPRTNKAISLLRLGKKEEAVIEVEKVIKEAENLGIEAAVDKKLALKIQQDIVAVPENDNELLRIIAERVVNAFQLTSRQEMNQWKGVNDGSGLLKGLKRRVLIAGKSWNNQYIRIIEEMLVFFSPETASVSVMKLSSSNPIEYGHCLYAVLFLAAHRKDVMLRDACHFIIYVILSAVEPEMIKKVYREAILGSTAVGPDEFANLEQHMLNEIGRFNPVLIKLLTDQPPLTKEELEFARHVTMARFIDGISRDPEKRTESPLKKLLNKFLRGK